MFISFVWYDYLSLKLGKATPGSIGQMTLSQKSTADFIFKYDFVFNYYQLEGPISPHWQENLTISLTIDIAKILIKLHRGTC